MTNPFDAAIPAMIECYESNVAYYRSGAAKPNYPVPAIRYGTMLLNWKGEHRFVVVYANQWCGYATLISDEYVK